jgi:hypothetical protein
MRMTDWMALAFCVAGLAACSPPEAETPIGPPPPPPMRIEALDTIQLSEIITAAGPEGTLCSNLQNVMNHGVIPAGEGPHAAHAGAHAYSAHCIHRDLDSDNEAFGQQWLVYVAAVEPVAATVVPCFAEGQDAVNDTICWSNGPNQPAPTP